MWKCAPFLSILCLLVACKSQPVQTEQSTGQAEEPRAILRFERIEAFDPDRIALHFRLKAENPRPHPVTAEIANCNGFLNKTKLDERPGMLIHAGSPAEGQCFDIEPYSSIEKDLILVLDLRSTSSAFKDIDEYLAELEIELDFIYRNSSFRSVISANTVFSGIKRPQFTITSITIMQAELINTRFKVSLHIENPNVFPVALSSLDYELYGNNYYWAGGTEKNIHDIPAQSSSEIQLQLMMNFINMGRRLLDDVIAMRQVYYRFSGSAHVETGIPWLPGFKMGFDKTGNSPVTK
jgi:LEA14-like dessication related protein